MIGQSQRRRTTLVMVRFLGFVLAIALGSTACGGSDANEGRVPTGPTPAPAETDPVAPASEPDPPEATPVQPEAPAEENTQEPAASSRAPSDISEPPAEQQQPSSDPAETLDTSRIVALNGDLAEVVWALGLGEQVVATDLSATYPPDAANAPKVGYQRTLTTEGILTFEPTLVLGNTDAGPPEVIDQLRDAGIPVTILDYGSDLSAVGSKIRQVGDALGVPKEAEELATATEKELADAIAMAEPYTDEPSGILLYFRGADIQLIGGTGAGLDSIFAAIGVRDVASEAGIEQTVPLTPEALIELEPDVIVATTNGVESVGGIDELLKIPGISETPAGQAKRILAYDDQQLLGFGPRLPTLLTKLIEHVHTGATYEEVIATSEEGAAESDGAIDPEVEAVWNLVFNDLDADLETRLAGLADSALAADLEMYTRIARSANIKLSVTGVELAGDTATVTYDTLLNGNPVASDLTAPIVREPGTWLVPRETFCSILALARSSCSG